MKHSFFFDIFIIKNDMELRKCSLCKKELELSSKNFYKSKNEVGGFDYRCKPCKLTHYQNNKEKYKKNSKLKENKKFSSRKEDISNFSVLREYQAELSD